ncbi:hypothetical protein [Pontibacillus salipaludis]|uniref:DUF4367 domain-containing protein n=1 Tax=Pontibacillus salipaludis TaxID=1697394 RepID=A0ABQ1Q0F3_9BACI|nr:hypothetical protein [Pontibacillus salipaludis]GGD08155.1 hypothetical protein GCM10011389_14610 [Pontibacillus salipaludis]
MNAFKPIGFLILWLSVSTLVACSGSEEGASTQNDQQEKSEVNEETESKSDNENTKSKSVQKPRVIGLEEALSTLPKSFKQNLKLPSKVPFDESEIEKGGSVDKIANMTQFTMDWNAPDNGHFSVEITEEGNRLNGPDSYPDDVTIKNVTLKNGSKATFISNKASQQLRWLDEETNYLYRITAIKTKDDYSKKYSVQDLIEIANSMEKKNLP